MTNNIKKPTLAKRLRLVRKSKGKESGFVASILKLSPSTYSGYESGRTCPSVEKLEELADFYEVSVDYLLGRTNDTNKSEKAIHKIVIPLNEFKEHEIELIKRLIDSLKKEKRKEVALYLDEFSKKEIELIQKSICIFKEIKRTNADDILG